MSKIGFFNQTEYEITSDINIAHKVLMSAVKKEKLKNVEFNVIIVDDEQIQELNRTYRHIDKITDVITFALEDENSVIVGDKVRILGDIYIDYNKVLLQAKEYHHSTIRELCFLCVHGFYHLLGYDHTTEEEEKIMFQKQEEVLNENNIQR